VGSVQSLTFAKAQTKIVKHHMSSNLKTHLCWIIGVLTLTNIILLSVNWNGVKDLAGILNFALGLTSMVLAIIAIVYGFIANNAFSGTVSRIEIAASDINLVVKQIPDKLNAIDRRTLDMHQMAIAASSAPQEKPSSPPAEQTQVVKEFVIAVVTEFFRASSWNGLKLLYVCRICCEKKLEFDLKELCSLDNSMSYDYAFGYLVASSSASFLKFNARDENLKILVTFMPTSVVEGIMPAIKGRLDFVGMPHAKDFQIQLESIDAFIALVESANKKPLSGAKG
jgi:hypothetical protein